MLGIEGPPVVRAPLTWVQRMCRLLTGHAFETPLEQWREKETRFGRTWVRRTACICRRSWVEWRTDEPEERKPVESIG